MATIIIRKFGNKRGTRYSVYSPEYKDLMERTKYTRRIVDRPTRLVQTHMDENFQEIARTDERFVI